MRLLVMSASLCLSTSAAIAQDTETLDFSGLQWTVTGSPVEATYRSQDAVRLFRSQLELSGQTYDDVVIEYDLAMEPGNGFSGILFRVNDDDGEFIYFRHHLSGQPDSTQYTPVVNGLTGWQIYTSPGYWQAIDFPIGEWVRVRLVVDGGRAQISLDGQPVFDIPELIADTSSGNVILRGFGQTGSWVSNISVRPLEAEDRLSEMEIAPAPEIDGHLIEQWSVSSAFDEALIAGATELPAGLPGERTILSTEHHGMANLARIAVLGDGQNTVLAETNIESGAAQTVMLRFGYSDRVRVYLNDTLLFQGDNRWRSRDYRYLGTITRDYAVPLRLEAGANRLTLAVSEGFGGWGVTGVLDDSAGLNTTP